MKTLFILINDTGDYSYRPSFTMNADWIKQKEEAYARNELDHNSIGVDSDGFHYTTLNVPDECTLESLGVGDCAYD